MREGAFYHKLDYEERQSYIEEDDIISATISKIVDHMQYN
jgi:hypothetical protein